MYDENKIKESYDTFSEIVEKLENKGLSRLVEDLGEDLLMSPAHAQKDEYGCRPAGLIDFALDIAQVMRKLNVVGAFEADTKSIYTVALLRAIGEYGTSFAKMFEPHDSDWHVEKLGLLYKRNPTLNGTTWAQRCTELVCVYSVTLSSEEIMALTSQPGNPNNNSLAKLLDAATTIIL